MPIIPRIADRHAGMTEWRRDPRAHPELASREVRTSGLFQRRPMRLVFGLRAQPGPPVGASCWAALAEQSPPRPV